MLRLRVAELTLRLRSPCGLPPLAGSSRPFASTRGADIDLDLSTEPVPRPRRESLLFDSGGVWRVYGGPEGLLYTFRTPLLTPPVYKGVAIDSGLSRGILHYPRARAGHPLAFPLDELLFQHRLAREGAFEVHACGVVVGRGVVVFCGRSGAGKSTTARLWREHRPRTKLLSDDRIVVRERRGKLFAFGTPWHGDGGFAAPEGLPLRAVFFLRHGRRERIVPVSPGEAAARLFARTFPPPWDSASLARVLDTCGRVASEVPCRELRFRPEASAVREVLGALGEA